MNITRYIAVSAGMLGGVALVVVIPGHRRHTDRSLSIDVPAGEQSDHLHRCPPWAA